MLKIDNLNVSIDNKNILNGFNLVMEDGSIHVFMGPNGIGKSTISKVIMGSKDYDVTGSILYNGDNLLDLDVSEIAKKGIFLLNQNPMAIEGVSNAEMIRVALNQKSDKPINIFEFNKELEKICKKLDLPKSFIHREINVGASGGERKKTELLHMWMLKPSFIILDELDSGLDVDALKICSKSILEYYETYHPTILIITHHTNILDYITPDKVHILGEGKIVLSGDVSLARKIESDGFMTSESGNENENE